MTVHVDKLKREQKAMYIFRKLLLGVSLLALCSPAFCDIKEGREYIVLKNTNPTAPKVVEFFSFYCSPCYSLFEKLNVNNVVSASLPKETKLTQYHVGQIGPLGPELTEAWAVAMALGIEDKIKNSIFEETQVKHSLTSRQDIYRIFEQTAGISEEQYNQERNSANVKSLITLQNNTIDALNVTGTPSIYISGKYMINNGGITDKTPKGYPFEFAKVVDYLLSHDAS